MSAREAALERDRAARERLADDPVHQIKQRRPPGGGPMTSVEVEGTWGRGGRTDLTEIESGCLQLAADGYTNAEIAARLGRSVHTVKCHMKSVLRRLGARDRPNAVAIGLREGRIS